MAKQNAMLTMVMRWVWGLRLSSHFMAKWMTTPTPMATRKNSTVWMSTPPMPVPSPELAPSTQVSTMMPMTSSMTAALTMVVPRKLFRWPSSCSVATVMETLVAVMMVPMNSAR